MDKLIQVAMQMDRLILGKISTIFLERQRKMLRKLA